MRMFRSRDEEARFRYWNYAAIFLAVCSQNGSCSRERKPLSPG
jgi:hypothetical protein